MPEARKQTSTIKDVARRANVSVATVSAVINHNRFVSNELVERVIKAIQELGYRPNRIAQGLKKRKSFSLVYIIPDITNPIFAGVTRGIQDVMERLCYNVSIYNTDFSDKKLFHHLTTTLENRPDGIVLSAWHSSEIKRAVSLIQELGIPLVIVHAPRNIEAVDAVLVDEEKGGFEAASYLLELGHRNIVSLGVMNSTTSFLREQGYRRALKQANIPISEEFIIKSASFSSRDGCDSIYQAVNSGIKFAAIFAHSDSIAVGAIEALNRMGLRVPEVVSVVGFDGTYAFSTFPKLTTMLIPNREMGKRAAEILSKRMAVVSEKGGNVVEMMKPQLLVQDSTQRLINESL